MYRIDEMKDTSKNHNTTKEQHTDWIAEEEKNIYFV